MSPRLRLGLALLGVAVLIFASATLVYVWWPTDATTEQFRPAPTLFAPP